MGADYPKVCGELISFLDRTFADYTCVLEVAIEYAKGTRDTESPIRFRKQGFEQDPAASKI